MKNVPNILSISRVVVFSPLLIVFMIHHMFLVAMMCLAIGILTDWLDGYVAQKWHASSKFGADILEPVTDLVLATVAVVMLITVGYWSVWVGVGLIAIAGALQAISWLAGSFPGSQVIKRLKRHQNYIHPFFAVIVMVATLGAYIILATDAYRWLYLVSYAVVVIVAIGGKRDRIREMMRAPQ